MSQASEVTTSALPRTVFEAPLMRSLDERAKHEIERSGRLIALADGQNVYRAGEASDTLFVVVSGEVRVAAVRRGDEEESELRLARRGDTFGEEAALPGAKRWAGASARGPSVVVEIPVGVLVRALSRSGGSELVEREERALRRAASRDLLRTLALSRDLPDDDLEVLLDAVRWENLPRRARLYGVGDPADAAYLVAEGLLQLQTEHAGRAEVRAYLSRGDFFGDEEVLDASRRKMNAVALGDCQIIRVPRSVMRTLVDRNPGIVERMQRIRSEREAHQRRVVGEAAQKSTQHVFQDLYRTQMARSLLAIDQEACVRCGHCAWVCAETHQGVARLVRRGDKIVTQLMVAASQAPKSLMLPNSCQHCHNPVCMIDCPTGAIGRDPEGEVFIREDLCTGCGACAKACPWDNIRMAPRGELAIAEPKLGSSVEVAVKCDLCRDYDAPACVVACPTEAIQRLDPQQDFAEVVRLFGVKREAVKSASQPPARALLGWALPAAVAFSSAALIVGSSLHRQAGLSPGQGVGYFAGVSAGLACFALAGYSVPKRVVRLLMKRRAKQSAARAAAESATPDTRARAKSRLFPYYIAHIALGLMALGGAALHAGSRFPAGVAGALHLAFWLVALSGVFGAVVYRALPARLSRLERKGALPEDLDLERHLMLDRLHRATTGRSELVKKIAERLLVPYTRAAFGWIALAASGRTLREEEAMLRKQIDSILEGRGGQRLEGIEELVRTVVEIRALPARRALTAALRAWLPAHIIATGMLIGLLLLHIVQMTRW